MAAGNALVGLLLVGILGLQAGQEYARRTEERELREMEKRLAAAVEVEKKDK